MNHDKSISDELLHAYLDGELDAATRQSIKGALINDPGLCLRVERFRDTKNLVRYAFSNAMPPTANRTLAVKNRWFPACGVAASLFALALCFGAGVLGYKTAPHYLQAATASTPEKDSKRLVLHIGESDPERFAATLEYAEHILNTRREQGMMIEVVTNAGGIDLLRGGSPYEAKVAALLKMHPNIHFFACMNTLRNLERQGVNTKLLADVQIGETAVDHIVNRVLEGWTYIKMDHIPAI